MESVRANWNTGLAVLVGLFLLFLAFALGVSDGSENDLSPGAQVLIAVFAVGVPGLALLGGLWNLRSARYSRTVSYVGIVIGLVATALWFWMLLPPIAALVVLWFGVIRGGLARELTVA